MTALAQIGGIGIAGLTRTESGSADVLSTQAIRAAIADAGLAPSDIDGLLISRSGASSEPGLSLLQASQLRNPRLLQVIDCEGTSAIQMIHTASMAIAAGAARHVVCVFCDTPLRSGNSGREAFTKPKNVTGLASLRYCAGAYGGAANYALSAAYYLHQHGLGERHLGAVAVSTRAWACLNPLAVLRKPLTLDDYLAARFIVKPLRLFDCALPVNGAIAVVVSAEDHAPQGPHGASYIHGLAQAHDGAANAFPAWRREAACRAGAQALAMARIGVQDVDVRELYDAFTIMTLQTLEDYGFCGPGEAGHVAESGALGPGGRLPTNTGGGQLSAFYMQGMTPVAEAVWQSRGEAGARQCERHDVVLATNEGGWYDHHACLVLSKHRHLI